MLTDITLGQYFPGNSPLHRLDPRTKILGLLLYITTIFMADSYTAYACLIGFAALLMALSTIPPRLIAKSIKPLWIIIIFTILIHIFTTKGTVLYQLGPFPITREGVRQAVLMSIRLVLLISISSLLTFTTSPIALTDALEKLMKPLRRFGVPAHELAMMMTIALRFIPTLLEETDRIMKAQQARGADFVSGNLLKRIKNMIPLLVPLFVSAFRRADELAVAMEARCYRGGENRTRMKELRHSPLDYIAYGIVILFVAVVAALKYHGG